MRELTFTQAYQTWTKEAHEIEDALLVASERKADLGAIGQRVDEILYRMLLQVRLRRAKVIGGDDVRGRSHPGIRARIEAAVAALTTRP